MPAKGQIAKPNHHAALPYDQMPEFWSQLTNANGIAACAREFTILTVARTCEAIGARWDEIDFENKTWIGLGEVLHDREGYRERDADQEGSVTKPRPNQDLDSVLLALDLNTENFRKAFLEEFGFAPRDPRIVGELERLFRDALCDDPPRSNAEVPLHLLLALVIRRRRGNPKRPLTLRQCSKRTLHIVCRDSFNLQREMMPDLGTPEGRQAIDAIIKRARPDLAVLDSLSTLVQSGEENSAEDWRPVQDWLMSLRWRGRSMLLVHHSGKSRDYRGTSKPKLLALQGT